jgi:hypothetical protein
LLQKIVPAYLRNILIQKLLFLGFPHSLLKKIWRGNMPKKITRELKVKIMFKVSRQNDLLFSEVYEKLIKPSNQKFDQSSVNSSMIDDFVSYQQKEVY